MQIQHTQLRALFLSFFKSKGGDDSAELQESNVLEFVSGDTVMMVLGHPSDENTCIFEVQIRKLDLDHPSESAHALLMLHRINYSARFEHGWMAAIDEADMLLLTTMMPIDSLNEEKLEETMADGLERAASLNELWKESQEKHAGSSLMQHNARIPNRKIHSPLDRA